MDDDLDDEMIAYLDGLTPNWDMVDVEVLWVENDPRYGSFHIAQHGVSEAEVEEVLFEIPPEVEAKRHPAIAGRTNFWGATRTGRWLFVVSEDWTISGVRYLRPITAFEPEEGRNYWEEQS
jgi:hypothetical protein